MALNSISYQIRIKDSDGSYYYPPKTKVYVPTIEDLMTENTKRSAKGILVTERIGSFPDISMAVGKLNSEQMSQLLPRLRRLPIIIDWFDAELGDYRRDVQVYAKTKSPTLLKQNPIVYDDMDITLTAYRPV